MLRRNDDDGDDDQPECWEPGPVFDAPVGVSWVSSPPTRCSGPVFDAPGGVSFGWARVFL